MMARVTLLDKFFAEQYFYNVDEAVGSRAPNRRQDVLLVQYFLKIIFDNPIAFQPRLPTLPGPPLTVDGISGPITLRAIKTFQELCKAKGMLIATDGRVDKAESTILFLNKAYRKVRPNDFRNIANAADCPRDLASAVAFSGISMH